MNHPAFDSPFPSGVAFAWSGSLPPAPSLLPEEAALLPPESVDSRSGDFALGRACAHAALVTLGAETRSAPRPILRDGSRMPRWPEGIRGSITHTHGIAAAAVAWERDFPMIGLDLEDWRRGSSRLGKRILRPEERAAVFALPEAEQGRAIATIFAAKESIYKALNPLTGIYLGFQDGLITDLDLPLGEAGGFRWQLTRPCGSRFAEGFGGTGQFRVSGHFVLAGLWA